MNFIRASILRTCVSFVPSCIERVSFVPSCIEHVYHLWPSDCIISAFMHRNVYPLWPSDCIISASMHRIVSHLYPHAKSMYIICGGMHRTCVLFVPSYIEHVYHLCLHA